MTRARHAIYRDAAMKTAGWLAAQMSEDGSFGPQTRDLASYYKAPYLLHLAGRSREAHRVLDFVKAAFLQPDGDFVTSPRQKTIDPVLSAYHGYINGWLAIAATRLGRFDVAVPAWTYLRGFHHPGHGGFTLSGPYDPKGTNTVETLMSAHLGLAALYRGEIERAEDAGRALGRFLAAQPDRQGRLLLRMDDAGALIASFPDEAAALHAIEAHKAGQAWFFAGYPIGFATQLYLATGEGDYLDTARGYADFALASTEHLAPEHFAHKVAWGAALLARVTDDARLRELATGIADHLLAAQSEHGTWMDDQPVHTRFDQSAEVAIWLLEIAALL